MGFKKGWKEWKKTKAWRKAHGLSGGTKATSGKSKKKTSKSSKSYTKRSNPSGGASTTAREKIGVLFRKIRTMANILAPGAREASPWSPTAELDVKLYRVLRNYSGYDANTGRWRYEDAAPSWQGILTSVANDWFDRKTGTSAKISRGKLVHILKEALPMVQAHMDARGTADYAWNFYNTYNKRTTGYSMQTHTWDLDRANLYAGAKVGAWVYDKIMPTNFKRMLNSAFPKGVNPF